jgi:hypothetical protein
LKIILQSSLGPDFDIERFRFERISSRRSNKADLKAGGVIASGILGHYRNLPMGEKVQLAVTVAA